MKFILLLNLALLFFPFLLLSQNETDKFAQELVKNKFITKDEATRILSDSRLFSLYDIHLTRLKLKRDEINCYNIPSLYPDPNLKETKRLKFFLRLLKKNKLLYLENYKDLLGKIKVYEKQYKKDPSNIDFFIIGMTLSQFNLLHYLYEYEIQLQNMLQTNAYIEQMKELDIIEDSIQIKLKELQNKSLLLKHLKRHLFIPWKDLPEDISEAYRYAFEQLKQLHPSLEISDYSFEIKIDTNTLGAEAIVSFKNAGKFYREGFLYFLDEEEENQEDKKSQLSGFYPYCLNRSLVNTNSPYRLIRIEDFKQDGISYVLLTKAQLEMLNYSGFNHRNYRYFEPAPYKFWIDDYHAFRYYTEETALQQLNAFDSLGFYRGMGNQGKDSLFNAVTSTLCYSAEDIFNKSCSNIFYFFWNFGSSEEDYIKSTKEFALASNGDFTPSNIKASYNSGMSSYTYEFTFKGKVYKADFEDSKMLNPAFLELIKKAVEEHQLPGKFYDITERDEEGVSVHIYLTPQQYNYIKETKLLEFWGFPSED